MGACNSFREDSAITYMGEPKGQCLCGYLETEHTKKTPKYHFYTKQGFRFREWNEGENHFVEVENIPSLIRKGYEDTEWRVIVWNEPRKIATEQVIAYIRRNTAIANLFGTEYIS